LWRLNLDKSTFPRQAPKEFLVKIQHREPTLTQTLLVVGADSGEPQLTLTYDTSGSETTNRAPGGEVQSRATWSGSELIIESVLKTPARTFHFVDHWTLSSDGQTLRMEHPDDDLAGQISVLEKAPPDAARFRAE
jgi:hypothetical protein